MEEINNPTQEEINTFVKKYMENNEKTLEQIVHHINNNINLRLNKLEGNLLLIKRDN